MRVSLLATCVRMANVKDQVSSKSAIALRLSYDDNLMTF